MPTFAEQISQWVKVSRSNGSQVVRTLALKAYSGLLLRSPVDEGRFRGSWRVGINRVNGATLSKGKAGRAKGVEYRDDPNGLEEIYAIERTSKATWNDTIILSNSLPYAQRLEDGYSKQNDHKPGGILKDTLEEVRADLAKSIKNAIGAA